MKSMALARLPRTLLVAPFLVGLLVVHFVAVALFVCPPNPVSLGARPWVHAWVLPYFSQRWELFAPNPGGTNEYVHVRCHLDDGNEVRTTDWIDVTTPLIAAHQRNRLGSASRLLRGFQARLALPQTFVRRAVEHLDGPIAAKATEQLDAEAREVFEVGKAHLQRIASVSCKQRFARDGVDVVSVEARQVSTHVPPWGTRDAPGLSPEGEAPEGRAFTLPPMDYVEVSS